MYNLAKLLTEEPQKLERLGILFLKLLITLYIVSVFFGFDISISGFIENPIPKDYTIIMFVLFLIFLILTWFIVWSLIAESLFSELLIWILSRIGNKKNMFSALLVILNVVKKENGEMSPAKNVIIFNKLLHEYSERDEKKFEESKSRIRQYYTITLVIYIVLLFAKDISLPCWLKWVGSIMILNFLFGNIILNQIHDYFIENRDEMKKQYGSLAYTQMIINSIELNPFIKNHYKRDSRWLRINLKRITEIESLPETLKIYPFFHWNEVLLKELLVKELQRRSEKHISSKEIGKHYDVVISNFKPDDENIKRILSQKCFAYLYCENEEQIVKNIEVFLFNVTNGMYQADYVN